MLRKKKKNLWNKNLANKKQIHKKDCLDLTSDWPSQEVFHRALKVWTDRDSY